jgi:7-cyano-7-deazaguanine synthase
MLSIAVGFAESKNLKRVLIASHSGDHAIYPDCRRAFTKAIDKAAARGTYNQITIEAPFSSITKRQIALMAIDRGFPVNETYSCYEGQEVHCGQCGTCVERKEALAGFDDTKYKV